MATALKTFDDLSFHTLRGRDEAVLDFDNGFGVHIWMDVKWHDKEWRYAGSLIAKSKQQSRTVADLLYRRYMSPEDVTEYMKEVQELK